MSGKDRQHQVQVCTAQAKEAVTRHNYFAFTASASHFPSKRFPDPAYWHSLMTGQKNETPEPLAVLLASAQLHRNNTPGASVATRSQRGVKGGCSTDPCLNRQSRDAGIAGQAVGCFSKAATSQVVEMVQPQTLSDLSGSRAAFAHREFAVSEREYRNCPKW
jgi:hypothetical protein